VPGGDAIPAVGRGTRYSAPLPELLLPLFWPVGSVSLGAAVPMMEDSNVRRVKRCTEYPYVEHPHGSTCLVRPFKRR
jgi:hypothetical protein